MPEIHTRHIGAGGIVASIVAPALSAACGSPIDPSQVDASMALSVAITLLDWFAAHKKDFKIFAKI